MAKVYKSNNKLIVVVPNDVISALGLKEGDDLDFLEYVNNTYILAKKNDIVKLLAKSRDDAPVQQSSKAAFSRGTPSLGQREIDVLKKLDTLRYSDRTGAKVNSVLNGDEKEILQSLIKRRIVNPFKKEGEKEMHYGIQKEVYDAFLYRKGRQQAEMAAAAAPAGRRIPARQQAAQPAVQRGWERDLNAGDSYMDLLENRGYLVLSNEAEAAMVSSSLEDSIRRGLVLGTRAFNKKFYIGLRGYINKNALKILKLIDQKSMGISDISKDTGIDEDGVRTVLYVLSESGDVTEVRKDIFRVA
jgi:bifunctional DNA-binding transcriptional regulator/antitoxin component of YhaV-PrlF toxin-antitoxin module